MVSGVEVGARTELKVDRTSSVVVAESSHRVLGIVRAGDERDEKRRSIWFGELLMLAEELNMGLTACRSVSCAPRISRDIGTSILQPGHNGLV